MAKSDGHAINMPEINIAFNITGDDKINSIANTIDRIASNSKLTQYWKTQSQLIEQVNKSAQRFAHTNAAEDAKELVTAVNALSGMNLAQGFDEFDGIGKKLKATILPALEDAKALVSGTVDGMSTSAFRDMFIAFSSLSKMGGTDVVSTLINKMDVGDAESLAAALREVQTEYAQLRAEHEAYKEQFNSSSAGGLVTSLQGQLDDAVGELESIRTRLKAEVEQFADVYHVDRFDADWNDRFEYVFDAIDRGAMTSSEAIKELRNQYAGLFSEPGQADAFRVEQVQAFTSSLEQGLEKLEEVSSIVRELQSGGAGSGGALGGTGGSGGLGDLAETLKSLTDRGPEASQSVNEIIDSYTRLVFLVDKLSNTDLNNLVAIGSVFKSMGSIKDLKIGDKTVSAIVSSLSQIAGIQNLSNLNQISHLDFSGLGNLKGVSKASLRNLAEYLPAIAQAGDFSKIQSLSGLNLEGLNSLHITKSNATNLGLLVEQVQKLSEAIGKKAAGNILTDMLDGTAKQVDKDAKETTKKLDNVDKIIEAYEKKRAQKQKKTEEKAEKKSQDEKIKKAQEQAKKYAAELDSAQQKYKNIPKEVQADKEDHTALDNASAALKRYTEAVETYKSAVDSGNLDNSAQLTENIKRTREEFNKAAKEVEKLPNQYEASLTKYKNLMQRMTKYQDNLVGKNLGTKSQREELRGQVEALREFITQAEAALKMPNGAERDAALSKLFGGTPDEIRRRGREYTDAFNDIMTKINASGSLQETFGEKVVRIFKDKFMYGVMAEAAMQARQAFREMVTTVVELDTAMVELQKVTNATDAQYAQFFSNAATRAKTYGATMADTINATADFARLGFDIDDASKLADAALVYKNVGDDINSIDDASSSIVSTLQAFGIEAENVMSIVDKFNAVGNNFAISSGGAGEALKRSASALHAAGADIDESLAMIAAGNTVIQDPDKMGTVLKTLSMYLRSSKVELEEAGESTEGMASSVSKLRASILALTDNKVDIMWDDNTYKGMFQVYSELSKVYKEMSDIDQAALLELLGGKRNANVTAALLENFNIAEEALAVSQNAAGSALAENEKVLDSIQGRVTRLKATFEEFSSRVINGNLAKGLVTAGDVLLKIFSGLTTGAGGLGSWLVILPTIGSALSGLFAKIQQFRSGASEAGSLGEAIFGREGRGSKTADFLVGQINKVKTAFIEASQGMSGLPKALAGAKGVWQSFTTGAKFGIIASGVIAGLSAAYNRLDKYQTGLIEKAKESAKTASDAYAEAQNVSSLYNDYAVAKDAYENHTGTKQALTAATNALTDALGKEAEASERAVNAMNGDKYAAMVQEKYAAAVKAQKVAVVDAENAIQGLDNWWTSLLADLQNVGNALSFGIIDLNQMNLFESLAGVDLKTDSIDTILNKYDELVAKQQEMAAEGAGRSFWDQFFVKSYDDYSSAVSFMSGYIDTLRKAKDAEKEAIDASNKNLVSSIAESTIKQVPTTLAEIADLRTYITNAVKLSGEFNNNGSQSIADILDNVLIGDTKTSELYSKLREQERIAKETTEVRGAVIAQLAKMREEELKAESADGGRQSRLRDKNRNAYLSDGLEEYRKAYEEVQRLKSEMDKAGVKDQSIFGNIDLDNRQVLKWTKENIEQYRGILESWAAADKDLDSVQSVDELKSRIEDYVQSFKGSISTVLGGSTEREGIPIAFSPILQTDHGPVLLDDQTVGEYFDRLFDAANGDFSAEHLLALDSGEEAWEGFIANGERVKNLIADLGDTADANSYNMHLIEEYRGASKALQELHDWYGITIEDIEAFDRFEGLDLDEKMGVYRAMERGSSFIDALNSIDNAIARSERRAADAKETFATLWGSDDFKDTRKDLEELAKTGGITEGNIRSMSHESLQLSEALEETGVSASYLAKILTDQTLNGNGFANITAELVRLDAALHSAEDRYTALDAARQRYEKNAEIEAKDQAFQDFGDAFDKAMEEITAGRTNSNQFWNSAELLLGGERLSDLQYDSAAVVQALKDVKWAFDTADDSGAAFLGHIKQLYDQGGATADVLHDLMDIHYDDDGNLVFDIPSADQMEALAALLKISPEGLTAAFAALGNLGHVSHIDVTETIEALKAMGVATEENQQTVINYSEALEALKQVYPNISDAVYALQLLQESSGTMSLSVSDDVDTTIQKLEALGIAVRSTDGSQISVDFDSLFDLLSTIGMSEEEIRQFFQLIHDNENTQFTVKGNTENLTGDVQEALDSKEFTAKVQVNPVLNGTIDDTNGSGASFEGIRAGFDKVLGVGKEAGETISDIPPVSQEVIGSFDAVSSAAQTAKSEVKKLSDEIFNVPSTKNISINIRRNSINTGGGSSSDPYPAKAKGTKGAKAGDYLTGELGPELVWTGDSAYLTGVGGPNMTHLKDGDVVYTAEETKKILSGMRKSGLLGSLKGGTGGGTQIVIPSSNVGKITTSAKSKATTNVSVSTNIEEVSEELEEQLKKLQEEINEILERYDFKIFMAEKHEEDAETIIAIYKKMQEEVHAQAEKYRAMGVEEESEYIRDLQKKWWEYADAIKEARQSEFEDWMNDAEFSIDVLNHNGASVDEIANSWKGIYDAVQNELNYYLSNGYDYGDEIVQDLLQKLWDAKEQIGAAREEMLNDWVDDQKFSIDEMLRGGNIDPEKIADVWKEIGDRAKAEYEKLLADGYDETDEVVQNVKELIWEASDSAVQAYADVAEAARSSLSDITSAFETLAKAQQEYNDTGYISIDTFQSLLSNGIQYLGMLTDENGQLVINADSVARLTQAKIENCAVTEAMSYLAQVQYAVENDEIGTLASLTQAVNNYTTAGWGAVSMTAQLIQTMMSLKGLDSSYAEGMFNVLNNLKSITSTVSAGVPDYVSNTISGGDSGGGGSETDERLKALQDVIKWTEDLIKFEHDQMVEALDDQLDKYKEIIDQKKKSLELTKSELSYNKKMSKQRTDIAKLQARINMLSLDDSREAMIERGKLMEELAELQEQMEEDQWDHAYDLQTKSLDKQADNFEDMIKKRQEEIKNEISSEQKLYDLAIDRIDNHWNELYDDLINWNYEYGNSLTSEITEAWGQAESALQQYGNTLAAIAAMDVSGGSSGGGGGYGYSVGSSNVNVDEQSPVGKAHTIASGVVNAFSKLNMFDTSTSTSGLSDADRSIVSKYVDLMKANSAAWHSADAIKRKMLSAENESLASMIASITGMDVHKDGNGVWWIGNDKLYDVYHKGGVVGGNSDEQFALLQKGEWVISKDMVQKLGNLIELGAFLKDKSETLANAFDHSVFGTNLSSVIGAIARPDVERANNTVIQVDASLSVSGVNDEEILGAIRRHPRVVAEEFARVLI